MRGGIWLLAVCVVSGLAGCAGPNRGDASGAEPGAVAVVQVGMGADEVEARLGTPLDVDRPAGDDGPECWYYRTGVVVFEKKAVTFTFPQARRVR